MPDNQQPVPVFTGIDWNAVKSGTLTLQVPEQHLDDVPIGRRVIVVESEEAVGTTGVIGGIITGTEFDETYVIIILD